MSSPVESYWTTWYWLRSYFSSRWYRPNTSVKIGSVSYLLIMLAASSTSCSSKAASSACFVISMNSGKQEMISCKFLATRQSSPLSISKYKSRPSYRSMILVNLVRQKICGCVNGYFSFNRISNSKCLSSFFNFGIYSGLLACSWELANYFASGCSIGPLSKSPGSFSSSIPSVSDLSKQSKLTKFELIDSSGT